MNGLSRRTTGEPRRRLGWDGLQIALAASLFFQTWRVQDLFPILGISGLPIAVSCVPIVMLLMDPDPRRHTRFSRQPIVRIAFGILVLVVLSIPGSLYPGWSITFLTKDFVRSIVALVLVATTVRDRSDIERLVWVQVIGATMFSAVVLERFKIDPDGRLGELVYYDSNDLALLIVCTLPLTVYLLRQSRSMLPRLFLVGAVVCLMLTLSRTGSRGGFLGLLAGGISMLFFLRAIPLPKRIGAIAVLTVLLVGFSSSRYWEMMQSILHPESDYNWTGNDTGRLEIWKRGLGYMFAHPLFGVGARDFSVAEGTLSPEATGEEHGAGFKWSEAHNSFVEIGAELGVMGLVLFVVLLVTAFRSLSRVGRGPPGASAFLAQVLTASLTAFVVSGFFLSAAYSAYLYALLGMVAALARIATPAATPAVRHGRGSRRSVGGPAALTQHLRPSVP